MNKLIEFENGLRLVLCKTDSLSVSFGMYVKAGCAYETPVNNGISHFIEHTMFKGTEKRTAFEISDTIDKIGGQLNAFTSKEATCYYTKTVLDPTYLETSFELISDMLFNSKFDQVELDKEKGVVLEEISMVEDTPDDKVFDCIATAVYKDHPLAQAILGTPDNVKRFTHEDIKRYMAERYTPNNIVLSLVGNFDEEQAAHLAKTYFADKFPVSKTVSDVPVSTNVPKSAFVYQDKKIEQSHIVLSIPSVSYGSENYFKIMMVNYVFGGGMTSRLFQSVREQKGLCYSIYTYSSAFAANGNMIIYVAVNPKNIEEATRAIKDEIVKIKKDKITKEEFERAKAQCISMYVFAEESTTSIMNLAAKEMLGINKLTDFKKSVEEMRAITLDDVNSLIDNTFDTTNLSAALLGPKNVDILSIIKG